MLLHLLKKLLVALVALSFLGTILFLLSRLLPGSFGEERILQREASYYSTGDESSRQKAFVHFQKKAGLHKPLFYLSISPTTLPDSIELVFPEARRNQLKKLMFMGADWSAVAAYDALVNEVMQQQGMLQDTTVKPYLHTLRYSSNLEELQKAVQQLANMPKAEVQVAAAAIAQQLLDMQSRGSGIEILIPKLNWHGTDNQYHLWLTNMFTGDMGRSYRTEQPVLEMVWEAIGNTFGLLLCSMSLTLLAAVELAIQMSKGRMQWLRRLAFPTLFALDSIPLFVLALLLLVLLANPDFIQLFPMYGMGFYTPQQLSVWQQIAQWFQFMALPILVLVLTNLPYITNQVYTSLQAALKADYVRTAKAKGLPERRIIRSHAFRNSLIPLITIVSEFLPALVDGAFIIETIFAIPGVGRLLVESVLARDYPVILAVVLVVLMVRMVAYALADIGYAWADPRIKQKLA